VDEEKGITEIAKPVGVVAAVTPSTNPGATPANKVMMALKGRNAVIVARPPPKGFRPVRCC
jgi:sulfoacetaldehyde dehydrogenase